MTATWLKYPHQQRLHLWRDFFNELREKVSVYQFSQLINLASLSSCWLSRISRCLYYIQSVNHFILYTKYLLTECNHPSLNYHHLWCMDWSTFYISLHGTPTVYVAKQSKYTMNNVNILVSIWVVTAIKLSQDHQMK